MVEVRIQDQNTHANKHACTRTHVRVHTQNVTVGIGVILAMVKAARARQRPQIRSVEGLGRVGEAFARVLPATWVTCVINRLVLAPLGACGGRDPIQVRPERDRNVCVCVCVRARARARAHAHTRGRVGVCTKAIS